MTSAPSTIRTPILLIERTRKTSTTRWGRAIGPAIKDWLYVYETEHCISDVPPYFRGDSRRLLRLRRLRYARETRGYELA
jgi:hypothetical protein